jgi:hypothetical protein
MPTSARLNPSFATRCGEPGVSRPRAADVAVPGASILADSRKPADAPPHAAEARPASLLAYALLAVVRGYQVLLSPIVGGACRFEPSCSQYMTEAIERHGAGRGSWLGIRRLARCHPLGSHGYDPVPPEDHS